MKLPLLLISILVGALSSIGAAQSPDARKDFVLTDKEAVGMLPARVVCPGMAKALYWSSDGSFLLVQRSDMSAMEDAVRAFIETKVPPGPEAQPRDEFVIYSMKGNKTKAVVPIGGPDVRVNDVNWLPGSSKFVVQYSETKRDDQTGVIRFESIVAMVSADGTARILQRTNEDRLLANFVSPTAPVVAVVDWVYNHAGPNPDGAKALPPPNNTVTIYKGTEEPPKTLKLPADFSSFEWGADGHAYVITRKLLTDQKKVITTWNEMNLDTGAFTVLPVAPKFVTKPIAKNLTVFDQRFKITNGVDAAKTENCVVLQTLDKSDQKSAIATADGSRGELAPNNESLAYISQGIAMVRPLVHMAKDDFIKARNAAIRTELLSNVKQVGLALIMYCNDYDDNYPSNKGNWQSQVDPYLKNMDIMNGFVLTFPGGSATAIESPAETQLGFIPGPGGKAVVFTDGHAKWIPDPPHP